MASRSNEFFKATDFRQVLLTELAERQARRKSYSLRAFARDLGVNPYTLSGALNGRYGISSDTARQIAKKLKFDRKQEGFFVALVESKHSRTKFGKKDALKRIRSSRGKVTAKQLNAANIELLLKWYYPAVLELISIFGERISHQQIADALKIGLAEADRAIETLLRHQIIKKTTEGYARDNRHLASDLPVPKPVVRDFHKQILAQAQKQIDLQPLENRRYLSTVLSFDKTDLERARKWLQDMHQEFLSEFATKTSNDSVYAFGLQLFQLDNGSGK